MWEIQPMPGGSREIFTMKEIALNVGKVLQNPGYMTGMVLPSSHQFSPSAQACLQLALPLLPA